MKLSGFKNYFPAIFPHNYQNNGDELSYEIDHSLPLYNKQYHFTKYSQSFHKYGYLSKHLQKEEFQLNFPFVHPKVGKN